MEAFEAWGIMKEPALRGIKKVNFFENEDVEVAPADPAAAATAHSTVATERSTAATADSTATTEHPTFATVVNGRTLSRCIQVVIGLGLVVGVFGDKDLHVYTGVDSDHELWIAVLIVMITTILVWE